MKITYIKTDFDKWKDQDDSEDDEQPNGNFEDVCTCNGNTNIISMYLYIASGNCISKMDNLHHRLIFDVGKSMRKNEVPRKNLLKVVKFQNLVANAVKYGKYRLVKLTNILYNFVLRAEIATNTYLPT